MGRWPIVTGLGLALAAALAAQQQPVPQPFPRPGERQPPPSETRPAEPARPEEASPDAVAPARTGTLTGQAAPTEAVLGVPVYPTAHYLTSYDAGQGQRFHLFGSSLGFEETVAYYSNVLRQRGTRVFGAPPTHVFEIDRFRQETMAFPPSVTIKDYTWGGLDGYLDPTPGANPARYPTVIQIIPPPAGDR